MTIKINQLINTLYMLAAAMIAVEYFSIGPFNIAYISCLLIIFSTILTNKKFTLPKNIYELIPLFFSLSYCYGVGLGFLKGNPTSDVISNFAGLFLFFFLYYFSISKFSFDRILKIIKIIALIFIAELIIFLLISLLIGEDSSRLLAREYMIKGLATSSGEYSSRYFITNSGWVFTLVFVLFDYIISGKKENINKLKITSKINNSLLLYPLCISFLVFILYLLIIKSSSKGFLLAGVIGLSIILASSFLHRTNGYIKLSVIFIIAISIILNNTIQSSIDLFNSIFSADASGNLTRLAQIDVIKDRLLFFGNGLGSNFETGDHHQYGIELTYLNLIDKLGIIGLLISLIYFLMYFKFAYYIIRSTHRFIGLLGLGLMSFIWPSIGNPMLLSVSYVIALLFSIRLICIAEQMKKHK